MLNETKCEMKRCISFERESTFKLMGRESHVEVHKQWLAHFRTDKDRFEIDIYLVIEDHAMILILLQFHVSKK